MDAQRVAAIVEAVTGSSPSHLEIVRTFLDHTVWDASGCFVKCGTRDDLEVEAWACERARALGLPAPRVLAMSAGDYLVLESVPGVRLGRSREAGSRPDARRALNQLGAHLRSLHTEELNGFGWIARAEGGPRGADAAWPDHLVAEFSWGMQAMTDVIDATQLERIRAELPTLVSDVEAGRLLHGDLQLGHIFVTPDGDLTGIIDWGDVHVGDPLWDIGVLASWVPEAVPHVLDGYEADAAFRERAAELIPRYRLVRHVWGYRKGTSGGWDESARLPIIRELLR